MTVVAASLWSVAQHLLSSEATRLAAAGVRAFHWDAADGSMSRAGGFDPHRARSAAPEGTTSEAHLMLRDPRPVLDDWTSWCRSVAVHASQPHWRESLELVEAAGCAPVLAVTTLDELELAPPAWGVLVMSITPGEAGGAFDERSFAVVEAAARRSHPSIGVDGSMTPERGRRFAALGATSIVSGSSLVASTDPAAWVGAATRAQQTPVR